MATLFDYKPAAPERFAIESGIPVARDQTERQRAKWEKPDFPFDRMKVGDSFAVHPSDVGGAPLIVTQNLVSGAAASFSKKDECGRKFTTRQMAGRYVRCWRIA